MQLIFPRWKYLILLVTILIGSIYALPNLYGEDPSLQITANKTISKEYQEIAGDIKQKTSDLGITIKGIESNHDDVLVRFNSVKTQLKAKDASKEARAKVNVIKKSMV